MRSRRLRNVSYFDGNAIARPLLVQAAYAPAGAGVVAPWRTATTD
jgi:hypothetical protein